MIAVVDALSHNSSLTDDAICLTLSHLMADLNSLTGGSLVVALVSCSSRFDD